MRLGLATLATYRHREDPTANILKGEPTSYQLCFVKLRKDSARRGMGTVWVADKLGIRVLRRIKDSHQKPASSLPETVRPEIMAEPPMNHERS